MIQVGGTITAACAPRVQVSSMCCSMKQVTLLWYYKACTDPLIYYYAMLFLLHKHSQISRFIYRLFTPRTTDGHNVFTVEELLLETLRKKIFSIYAKQYDTTQYNTKQMNVKYKNKFVFFCHKTLTNLSTLSALPILSPSVDPVMPYSTWLKNTQMYMLEKY